jgi:hypothetical protein
MVPLLRGAGRTLALLGQRLQGELQSALPELWKGRTEGKGGVNSTWVPTGAERWMGSS